MSNQCRAEYRPSELTVAGVRRTSHTFIPWISMELVLVLVRVLTEKGFGF